MSNLVSKLGSVMSAGGSLTAMLADAGAAAAYRGVHNADPDDPNGGDCHFERPREALLKAGTGYAPFAFGGGQAFALALGVGSGVLGVWAIGERYTLFEGLHEEDEEDLAPDLTARLRRYIGTAPNESAVHCGSLAVETGQLVIVPTTDSCDDVAARLVTRSTRSSPEVCGSDQAGLLIAVSGVRYEILLEGRMTRSWGTGRRCHLVPGPL